MPVVAFEDENGENDNNALQDGCRALDRFVWDESDIAFTFNQIEIKLGAVGVKKQYTKMQCLSTILPVKIRDEVKPLLRKTETEFPNNNAYSLIKKEILRIFGPRPEAAVEKALSRVLSSTPSQLARALVNDLCKKELVGCTCCPAIVLAMWKRHLPGNVRAGIAGMQFNSTTFVEVCQKADDIFQSNTPSTPSVAAVSLDETQPALPYPTPEVSAIRGGAANRRGRGNRGNRGRGRGSNPANQASSSANPRHKGPKHPDLPPGEWKGCGLHFKFGRGAHFCAEPASCPWKDVFTPRPSK